MASRATITSEAKPEPEGQGTAAPDPQSGPQKKFLKSRADIAIYGGAAGGGKTWALLREPLKQHLR
jgi:hypothetical protein